jgi:hypothetical protein
MNFEQTKLIMQQQLAFYRTTKSFKSNHKCSELLCENCKESFLANRNNARFCSSSCRSQSWLNKNDKKVITLTVPIDIDEDYLENIKELLMNYKPKGIPSIKPVKTKETKVFEDCTDLDLYLRANGYSDYKIPKIEWGIYYDEGLTIKKVENGWETTLSRKAG